MLDGLSRLLAVNGFLPHGYCISWSMPLILTYVVSDILIFLSYFSMPVALVYFARRREDFPYRWLLWLFAIFIMACGVTHLMGVVLLWQPLYSLDALFKAITAFVSVVTAVALWPMIPRALRLPSHEQLRRVNEELQSEIGERKRAEEALRLAKELAEEGLQKERLLMAAIVESSEDAIIGKALDGTITSWNKGAEKIFGYKSAEIVGRSVLTLIPPALLGEEERRIAGIRHGESIKHFETVRVRKDGSQIDVSVTISPIRGKDGRVVGASKIARDITDLKASEDALKTSEATLKAAQQLAGIGNWAWDLQSGVHAWSEEVYRIYGREPTLLPAAYPEVQEYFTPESWANLAATVEKSLVEGGAYECDAEVVRPDGAHRWITARGEAVRDAGGKILSLHGTVQDITERKLAEERIQGLYADLERRVVERTAELTAANHELDSFAYAVSHDLRAPLRAMSGFSQALIEDYGDRLDGEAKVYLDQIDISSRKMGELIDGILTLSRSTRGELQRDPIDISALAERLLEALARNEPERRIDWQVEPNLWATGDARMIEVVLHNLLGNAWKYTGKTASPTIRVRSGEIDGKPGICVSDNGAGFDLAHASLLYQPFKRLHRQEEFPGIGIGLATVQRIVHRHGGEIRAEGRPGAGARFCFTLPASASENIS